MASRTPEAVLGAQLRALGDETRLRIVALLARRPHYGEEMAEFLGLRAATISHHVKALRAAGLVSSTREVRHVLFELERSELAALGALLQEPDRLADQLEMPDEATLAQKVLVDWLDEEGRVRELPLATRARRIVLRWIALQLESDRLYPERELRFALMDFTREPDLVRDELVRHGWLRRAGTVYRRVEEVDPE